MGRISNTNTNIKNNETVEYIKNNIENKNQEKVENTINTLLEEIKEIKTLHQIFVKENNIVFKKTDTQEINEMTKEFKKILYLVSGSKYTHETCTYDNGVYDGELVNGKKEGSGLFKYKNGDIYNGEWQNDKKAGKGLFRCKNGDIYNGEWQNDKKAGKGTYVSNNTKQTAQWVNDEIHGEGTLREQDGQEYSCKWNHGKLDKKILIKNE